MDYDHKELIENIEEIYIKNKPNQAVKRYKIEIEDNNNEIEEEKEEENMEINNEDNEENKEINEAEGPEVPDELE